MYLKLWMKCIYLFIEFQLYMPASMYLSMYLCVYIYICVPTSWDCGSRSKLGSVGLSFAQRSRKHIRTWSISPARVGWLNAAKTGGGVRKWWPPNQSKLDHVLSWNLWFGGSPISRNPHRIPTIQSMFQVGPSPSITKFNHTVRHPHPRWPLVTNIAVWKWITATPK